MAEEIETINCEDQDEFLHKLDPCNINSTECIYRGHKDSTYSLMPSLWREENKNKFEEFRLKLPEQVIESIEAKIIKKFDEAKLRDIKNKEQYKNNLITWYLYIRYKNYLL